MVAEGVRAPCAGAGASVTAKGDAMNRWCTAAIFAGVALLSACASTPPPADVGGDGLVVVELTTDGLATKAGVEAGDVLVSWSRVDGADAPRSGLLRTPFDLDQTRVEESPRGAATLAGRRGERTVELVVGEGSWGLEVRPRLRGELDGALTVAMGSIGGDRAAALRELAGREPRPAVRAWLLLEAAGSAGVDEGETLWAEAAGVGRGMDRRQPRWWARRRVAHMRQRPGPETGARQDMGRWRGYRDCRIARWERCSANAPGMS